MKILARVLEPKYELQFTPEEVTLLRDASARHYDFVCKKLGQEYGVIAVLQRHPAVEVDRRTIDLLCKVMEMVPDASLYQQLAMLLGEADKATQIDDYSEAR